jgi:hypothetical protein
MSHNPFKKMYGTMYGQSLLETEPKFPNESNVIQTIMRPSNIEDTYPALKNPRGGH